MISNNKLLLGLLIQLRDLYAEAIRIKRYEPKRRFIVDQRLIHGLCDAFGILQYRAHHSTTVRSPRTHSIDDKFISLLHKITGKSNHGYYWDPCFSLFSAESLNRLGLKPRLECLDKMIESLSDDTEYLNIIK